MGKSVGLYRWVGARESIEQGVLAEHVGVEETPANEDRMGER